MTNAAPIRSALVVAALERATSPLMRTSVFELPGFRSEYGLVAEMATVFPGVGVRFRRPTLLDSVRMALSTGLAQSVPDEEGNEWALGPSDLDYEFPTLELSRSGTRIPLTDVASLSTSRTVRLLFLKQLTTDVLLPSDAAARWRRTLRRRPLTDAEVDDLHSDLLDTPRRRCQLVRRQAEAGNVALDALVPQSKRYFERLVGVYDGSRTIDDYSKGGGRLLLEGLRKRRLSRDMRPAVLWQALLLSAHPAIAEVICDLEFSPDDITRVVEQLGPRDDPMACVGAIEAGLSIRKPPPGLQNSIAQLVREIRDDADETHADRVELFAACFVLVDGQLIRTGLLAGVPPFYRRFAAICHASVLTRALLQAGINTRNFCEWARAQGGFTFYFGALADMRMEPGWGPEVALVPQVRQQIASWISVAVGRHAGGQYEGELRELAEVDSEDENQRALNALGRLFRTPLDGVCDGSRPIPHQLKEQIEDELEAIPVEAERFHTLIVAARMFDIDVQQAESAASALKRIEHRGGTQQPEALFSTLIGLASVAAVARSTVLANSLREATRRFGSDGQKLLSAREREVILLSAAASHHNLDDWVGWVGEVMTELAFGTLDRGEAATLLSHVRLLCRLVPDLWLTCGKAEAALRAVAEV